HAHPVSPVAHLVVEQQRRLQPAPGGGAHPHRTGMARGQHVREPARRSREGRRQRLLALFLELGAPQLPAAERGEHGDRRQRRQGQQQPLKAHRRSAPAPGRRPPARAIMARFPLRSPPMLQKLIIVAFLVFILYNLGAGLYYMIVDKGTTKRTVNSLTWRIGLSVALILLVILGIWTGVLEPHGVQG